MKILLVHHGLATSKEDNPERPLTEAGRADITRLADFLGKLEISPGQIFHSGKSRAAETAEILGAALAPEVSPEKLDNLAPMDDPVPVVKQADGWEQDTLIAGHLPHLAGFVGEILKGEPYLTLVESKPGTLILLEKIEGFFRVVCMVRPEHLRAMAG